MQNIHTRHPSLVISSFFRITRFASRFLLVLLILLASCDVIEAPFMENPVISDSTGLNPQKVLLLDFTGHTCKSCPKAHRTIEALMKLYGDRVVPIAFHLGYFAKPLTGEKFTTDFRTPEGTLLEKFYDFISFPVGSVQTLSPGQLQPYASWPASVSAVIQSDSPIKIQIIPEFLPGLNAITPEIKVSVLERVEGPLSLAVYLVEDEIVDWQKDEDHDPMDIPDYVHNHVFRTSLTGLWGELLGTDEGLPKGYTFGTEYSKILNADWKMENCTLVVFVYRNNTREIVQVETAAF